ncbi:MAG: SAM-dependent methyltransferase [Streptosporangiaceae bacterium]
MTDERPAPKGVDVRTPNVARMYDYYLGGKDNFAADRDAAKEVLAGAPEVRLGARQNRAFLRRAVRFLAGEAGIRQFIDIGTGLPTQGNTHEVAQQATPDARVAYVDYDPVVLAYSRALLSKDAQTTTIQADMRHPDEILNNPELRRLIDLDRPVAVLLLLMLHFVTDEEDPVGIVAQLREAMAPGSYIAISHANAERRGGAVTHAASVYDRATSSLKLRTREEILRLLDGFELVEPGLVFLTEWRPDESDPVEARPGWGALAAVGRKP